MYSEIQARDLLKYYPIVDPVIRTKPSHIRTHAVVNAVDFFTPLPIHLSLQQQVDRMLWSGYLNRNPMALGYWPGTNRAIAEMRERYRNKVRPNAPHATAVLATWFIRSENRLLSDLQRCAKRLSLHLSLLKSG